MKILLDNCVPYRARSLFTGHEVVHAKDAGWGRLENGKLLAAAARDGYDVLVTVDKKIRFEQNLETLAISILEINSPDSRLPEIQRLAPYVLAALPECLRYRFVSVDREGRTERLSERST